MPCLYVLYAVPYTIATTYVVKQGLFVISRGTKITLRSQLATKHWRAKSRELSSRSYQYRSDGEVYA